VTIEPPSFLSDILALLKKQSLENFGQAYLEESKEQELGF
jgi:hypothetical protein